MEHGRGLLVPLPCPASARGTDSLRPCRALARHALFPSSTIPGKPKAQLGHLATGFAIRRGIQYRRNGDLTALGAEDTFQRWGTDITVTLDGGERRPATASLRTPAGKLLHRLSGHQRHSGTACNDHARHA